MNMMDHNFAAQVRRQNWIHLQTCTNTTYVYQPCQVKNMPPGHMQTANAHINWAFTKSDQGFIVR